MKLVMDAKFQDKHYQIRKIQKEIRSIPISLKSSLGLILFNAVIHRLVAIKKRHEKKLFNLWRQNINV